MAVDYEQFFPYVLPFVPDVAETSALLAIRNSCIEFCERTNIWQENVDLFTSAGGRVYPINSPIDSRRATVMRVWVDDCLLTPLSKDTLTAGAMRDWRRQEGRPQVYFDTDGDLEVFPTPDATYSLRAQVAYTPSRDSLECGWDDAFDVWLEPISSGAVARLAAMPGTPYYNTLAADMHRRMFNKGLGEAKIKGNTGFGRGQVRMQLRPFARGQL